MLDFLVKNSLFKILIVVIVLDTIFGILRAIREKTINSAIGIDGIIRKCGMIITIIFFLIIDMLVDIDLICFIPEDIKNILHISKIGLCDLFDILFVLFEFISILKNMILCKLPIPKKLQKILNKLLKEFTQEIQEKESEVKEK